ncbi:U3 small nucleolar RNA-associated protein 4 [Geranomyces variabilis]|nr:U3 small nucleolar RNA-associated protein 4 [Geranomyces variabilis]
MRPNAPISRPAVAAADLPQRTLQVHRCRQANYSPTAIVSLSVTPNTSAAHKRHVKLACARMNGDLELWSPQDQNWFLERTIPGSPNSPIETVLWIHQSNVDAETAESDFDTPEERAAYVKLLREAPARLITAGLDGRIVEWDTISMKPRQALEVGGGAVWCASPNQYHTRLAVGCEDGRLRIVDVTDGRLEMLRLFEKAPSRIMSAVWHPSGEYIVTGGADSCIRKMNTRTGRTTERLTTGTLKGEETIVWDVKMLHDHTIVSADSTGNVRFWDWKSGTQTTAMRAHGADVLCIAVNKGSDKVWTAGVDRKVVQFSLIDVRAGNSSAAGKKGNAKTKRKPASGGDLTKQWIVSGEKRYHTHDVRALALVEGRPHDTLISGGVDTTLTFSSPLAEFPRLKQYRMPLFPHRPVVQMTQNGTRLMLVRFDDHVEVWRLARSMPAFSPQEMRNYDKVDYQGEELVLNLKPKSETNLAAAAMSEDGQWIAVSDMEAVKLFHVEDVNGHVRVRKAREFSLTVGASLPSAHKLCFAPDSLRLIIAGCDSRIYLVDLSRGAEGAYDIVATFSAHRGDEADDEDPDAMDVDGQSPKDSGKIVKKGGREMIATLAVSADGQWLASGDMLNRIHVFNLDALKHHATLPVFSSMHTTLTFHPSSPTLVVTCTSNEFYLYDCEDARLTDWSREYSQRLPFRWLARKEVITGVAFDPRRPSVMIMHGVSHVTFIDLDKPLGPRDATISIAQRRLMLHKAMQRERFHRRGRKGSDAEHAAEDHSGSDAAILPDHEIRELERKEFEKRKKAAAREIAMANGAGKKADDDVIVIESGDDEEGALPDDDDDEDQFDGEVPMPVAAISPSASARAGTKRGLNSTGRSSSDGSTPTFSNRGRLDEVEFSPAFQMELRYGPVMGVAFIAPDELVIVERPVLAVVQGLQVQAFYKHKYGT